MNNKLKPHMLLYIDTSQFSEEKKSVLEYVIFVTNFQWIKISSIHFVIQNRAYGICDNSQMPVELNF